MRPEDFRLNSDYVSLATATEYSGVVSFSPASVAGGTTYNQVIDIDVPNATKVICEYTISLDSANWFKTNEFVDFNSNTMVIISLQRVGNKTLRASLTAGNISASTETIPAYTIYIKEATIMAPDMN